MTIEEIAAICHNANYSYCESMGDESQVIWIYAPVWQQESAINGVKFHIKNPDVGPSGSHENWSKEKLAAGWKYGPVKDATAKTHPCLVPYEQLPQFQKTKDALFVAIVSALKGEIDTPTPQ